MTSENRLTFPQGVALAPSSLTIVADLLFEEWTRLGETLKVVHHASLFWLGDWLTYGEQQYGEMYAQAVDVTDYEAGTLRNAKWVASRIELSRRRDNLSWSHHQEVAPLEPDEQDEWMDRAEQGEDGRVWTVRRLRAEIQQQRSEREGHESKTKATIFVETEGNRVKVSLNSDTSELEELLTPVVDNIRAIVWESLNPVDDLVVDVTS